MPQLLDIFLFCGAFGFIWISGSALLGVIGSGADDGGSSNGNDSGDMGSAHSGGDSGDAGNADSDGDLGNLEAATVNTFRTGLVLQRKRLSPALLVLKLLSPSTLTTFMFFFGVAGYLTLHTWTALGLLSLVPAIIFGIAGYQATSAFSSMLIKKMQVNTSHTEEQIIGSQAEITVPIDPGRMGEVTYVANGVRHTAPARGADPNASFPKQSLVMVTDVQDGIFYVELWGLDETFGIQTPDQDKLPKVEKH